MCFYLIEMYINVIIRHCKAYKSNVFQILVIKIRPPIKRNIAALHNQVLLILD